MKAGLARRLLAGLAVLFVAAVVTAALLVLGWPSGERARRLDERRVEDLRRLAAGVDEYYQRNQVLPASLERLAARPDGPNVLTDPVTRRPYDYKPLGAYAYELCATFDDALPEEERGPWWHGEGRRCFSLDVRPAH